MEMRYEIVAGRLRTAIGDGSFPPGSRLPGLRNASRHYGVSLSTAIQAYHQLEAEGLVQARERSGFFVREAPGPVCPEPRPDNTTPGSSGVSVAGLMLEMIAASRRPDRCVNLGATLPDPDLLPGRALRRMLHEASAAPVTAFGGYGSIEGEPELRERIAQRMTLHGARVSPDEVVITNGGGIEALSIALQAVAGAGDIVAVESPTFYGMLQVLEGLGLQALELPTDPRTGLDPETAPAQAVAAGARALMIIPNGHNPLGYRMPAHAKARLVARCEELGLPIIEDDVYGELAPERQRPAPLKAWDRTGSVLLCSSFSKVLSPALRVGWITGGRWTAAVTAVKFRSSGTAASLAQRALAAYLRRDGYARMVRTAARHYAGRVARLRDRVGAAFPAGTRITRPGAGFCLWIELPGGIDATALYRRALARNIVIAPGELFAPGDRYRHCLRLNAAMADREEVLTAVDEIGRLAAAPKS